MVVVVIEQLAETGSATGRDGDPLSFRPNPDALVINEEEGEEEGGRGGGGGGESTNASGGVYKPPKLSARMYQDDSEKAIGRAEEKATRKME